MYPRCRIPKIVWSLALPEMEYWQLCVRVWEK
jgi:hypothetical protein